MSVARTAAVVSVLCLFAAPAGGDLAPDETGPFGHAAYETELHDARRDRSIGLLAIYPIDAEGSPARRRPLIVFNHGFLLSAEGYRSYGEHLASHGFVVAFPSLPMTLFGVDHGELADDVRFVVDWCLAAAEEAGHPLSEAIDPTRIGASGHSLGGKLSLLEAADDDRVLTAALLDPVDAGAPVFADPERYPSVAPERMPELDIPILFVGAELGAQTILFSSCAPEDENYQRFFEAANPPAIEITQLDVGHGQYVDDGLLLALAGCAVNDVPSDWVRSSSAAYLTAFFLWTLADSETAHAWLETRLTLDEAEGRISVRRK